jgi:hypothetical protein
VAASFIVELLRNNISKFIVKRVVISNMFYDFQNRQ